MTEYLQGQCDFPLAQINPDKNSYKPAFQHVFNEVHASSYVKIKCIQEGQEVYRFFDIVKRRFVEAQEIVDFSRVVLDLEKKSANTDT